MPKHWPKRSDTVTYAVFSACTRKRAYPTLEAAEQTALPAQVCYRCGFCGKWHLTRKRETVA